MSGDPKKAHRMPDRYIIQRLWHWWTKGDVFLTTLRAFKAARLSEQILTYFSGLFWDCISQVQAKIAYISAWKTVAYLPREKLSLRPTDYLSTPAPVLSLILETSLNQRSPLTAGGVPVALVQSSLVNMVTLYWGSKLYAGLITSTLILNMWSDCWSHIKLLLCPLLGFR